ncbi:MAG: YdcF family protein [Eubacterium sp.]|nr:YdcF family protein [Eubacterium sp.]
MSDKEKEVLAEPLTDSLIKEENKAAASNGEPTVTETEALNVVSKTGKPQSKRPSGKKPTTTKRKKPVEAGSEPATRKSPADPGNEPVKRRKPVEAGGEPATGKSPADPGNEPVKRRKPVETGGEPVTRKSPADPGNEPVKRRKPVGSESAPVKKTRPVRPEGDRPLRREGEPVARREGDRPARLEGDRPVRREGEPVALREGERPVRREGERPARREGDRPVRREGDRPVRRPQAREEEDRAWEDWEREKQREDENRKRRKRIWKSVKIVLLVLASLLFLFVIGTLAVNGYMLLVERRKVVTSDRWAEMLREGETTDCILVLGCSVVNQKPSADLKGRLDKTYELYKLSPHKILVSGDHSEDGYYNEVNVMKDYLVEKGIPSSDIFLDHYGFSTYDSIYRTYHTFGVRRVTIVTQDFHIYRSVFLARSIGMETIGVASVDKAGGGESIWNLREIFARDKDFLASLFWPDPVRTGDDIPLTGNGDDTNVRGK